MGYVLFAVYFAFVAWLLVKTPFIKKLPVPRWGLIALFAIKVIAGILYGWFFSRTPGFQQTADTWRMFHESLTEVGTLKSKPWMFFADIFQPRYANDKGLLAISNSYWNDIRSVLVVKMMAIFNLFTGSRYYVNIIFYEYLSFFGPVAMCRLFLRYFPKKKWLIICGAFFFPSTLFWCSGFHREGLLLSCIGVLTWMVSKLMRGEKPTLARLIWIAVLLVISFLLRNYITILFVLWCIPWFAALKLPDYKWVVFGGMALLLVGLFFASPHLPLVPNMPKYLAERQQAFLEMPAESVVQREPLEATTQSYIDAAPEAMINGFFEPFPTSGFKKKSYLPAMIETVLFIFLLLFASIDYRNWNSEIRTISSSRTAGSLIWFCMCFAITICLLIGYTIPYLGAIVRYKSVMWPFLVLPLLIVIPTKKQIARKMKLKKTGSLK